MPTCFSDLEFCFYCLINTYENAAESIPGYYNRITKSDGYSTVGKGDELR